jgi:hypothetical protein
MRRTVTRAVLASGLLLAAAASVACATQPESKTVATESGGDFQTELERYLPLEDGTVFSYDTKSEDDGGHGLLIVQISRPRKGRADLRMGGRTERLELRPDGIAYLEGGYLLKGPISSSTTWRSKTGTVHVANTDEKVTVPAGEFNGCLRTVEETREPGVERTVTSIYCPHVGLVSLAVEGASDVGHQRETAVLKSFGPRVDLSSEDVTTTIDR